MAKRNKIDYFESYEELTALAIKEAEVLVEACDTFKDAKGLTDLMGRMHEYENAGDGINHDIFACAAVDFVPPFDREDIVDLAQALDNVLDYIDDVVGHMQIYAIATMPDHAKEFAALILKQCRALNETVVHLRNFKKSDRITQLIVDINSYEEEGDKLYRDATLRLHTVENDDVMHILVWSRIYERMEKCCDAAEHAANIISTIVMKS